MLKNIGDAGRACLCLFAVASASFLLFTPSVLAAEIGPASSDTCNIHLTGPIEPGDAKKLAAVIEATPPREAKRVIKGETVTFERADVCLDSVDGSFAETLEIIKLFGGDDWASLGTVVDEGAECIGPCALIFMSGRFHAFHGITFPLRQLHVGGKIGFRTLSPSALASDDKAAVAKAFADAVKQTAQILKQNVENSAGSLDRNRPFPKSLTAAVLSQPLGQTLFVETLEQANKWQITLLGLPKPATITTGMLWTACGNHSIGFGSRPPKASAKPTDDAPVAIEATATKFTFEGFGDNAREYCELYLYGSPDHGPVLNITEVESLEPNPDEYVSTPESIKEFFDDGAGDFGQFGIVGEPVWLMYPPSTRINEIADIMQR